MKNELFINGNDAYEKWGISLSEGSLTALLTPPTMKGAITNESRLQHGKQVYNIAKVDSRQVSLELHFSAHSRDEFFNKYLSFCEELKKGKLEIITKYQPDVVYRFLYLSCTQFKQFNLGIAKFTLKLDEYNPTGRTL